MVHVVHVATALGVAVLAHLHTSTTSCDDPLVQRKARASTIRTLGTLLWPSVLMAVVPREDHAKRALALPLAWGFGAWLLDAHFMHRAPSDEEDRPATLRLDPLSIAPLSFGLNGLLKPDGKYTHLFLYAIVGCLVIVLPSHNLRRGCVEEQVFESVQKAALIWCIGFLLTGTALVRAQ
jgi:hypothetical protein